MNKNPAHLCKRLMEQGGELLRSRSKEDVAHAALLTRTRWYNEHLRQKGAGKTRHPRKVHTDARRIDFIVEHAKGRTYKMAAALTQRGFHLRAYFLPWTENVANAKEAMQAVGIETVECKNKADLFRALRQTDAFVIHHFLPGAAVLAEEILTKLGDALPCYAAEHYDVFNGLYVNVSDEWKRQERFVFEHADGVIFREFSAEFLEHDLGFHFRNRPLIFLDYNTEDGIGEIPEIPETQELSLVYAGGVATEAEHPGMSNACMLDFASICEQHHCHFHFYPVPYDPVRLGPYIERSKNSVYFHFHRAVPFTQLYKELSQYDYAVLPYRKDVLTKEIDGYYTREKNRDAGTNKFFDSIVAGLPIVSLIPERLIDYFSSHGIPVIRSSIEDMDFDDLKRHRAERRREVLAHRHFFTMDEHIDDLIAWYRSL